MSFLEITGADLSRGNLCRNRKHWNTRAVTVEKTINEVQVTRATATSTNGQCPRQMRFGTSRKGRDLFMPDVDPLDLALAAERVGEAIEAIADDAINPLYARCGQRLSELIGH